MAWRIRCSTNAAERCSKRRYPVLCHLQPLGAPRDAPPKSAPGRAFVALLGREGDGGSGGSDSGSTAFEELYCATYLLLDATWLEMRASYMWVRAYGTAMQELGRPKGGALMRVGSGDAACGAVRTLATIPPPPRKAPAAFTLNRYDCGNTTDKASRVVLLYDAGSSTPS